MKLINIVESKEDSEKKGTFVGVRLSKASQEDIMNILEKLDIPNPITKKDMHLTVIYSRKNLPEFAPKGKLDKPITITPKKLDIFRGTAGTSNALVIKMDSPELIARHKEIMDDHEATYDFPEYIPHLTLSYDCGTFDPKGHDISKLLGELEVDNEYDEELDLEWSSKK